MPHELFYNRFPEIAETETRTIIVSGPELYVPTWTYPVWEYYCTEDDCDCWQVYLHVMNDATLECEGIISFGWEAIGFYKKWNHGVVDDMIRDFRGPALGALMF